MVCLEYSGLLQDYETALRRLAQVEWNGPNAPEKQALGERDAARERLNLHARTCPTCIHNQYNPHSVSEPTLALVFNRKMIFAAVVALESIP
jgi:hypothetical protein